VTAHFSESQGKPNDFRFLVSGFFTLQIAPHKLFNVKLMRVDLSSSEQALCR
jgi:hypothetical protein